MSPDSISYMLSNFFHYYSQKLPVFLYFRIIFHSFFTHLIDILLYYCTFSSIICNILCQTRNNNHRYIFHKDIANLNSFHLVFFVQNEITIPFWDKTGLGKNAQLIWNTIRAEINPNSLNIHNLWRKKLTRSGQGSIKISGLTTWLPFKDSSNTHGGCYSILHSNQFEIM